VNKEKFTLIGAGLAGPLMATYLAKKATLLKFLNNVLI